SWPCPTSICMLGRTGTMPFRPPDCRLLWLLVSFARQACQHRQPLQILGQRARRTAPEDDAFSADLLVGENAAPRPQDYARLDGGMVAQADLPANDRAIANFDTAR